MVRSLAGYGVHKEDIAKVIECSVPTLVKYFGPEIDTAPINTNARVAQNLLRMATSETHPKAAIAAFFWLKCRAGWKENQDAAQGYEGKKEVAQREAEAIGAGAAADWGNDLSTPNVVHLKR